MNARTPACGHCGIDILGTHVRDTKTGDLFCGAMCHYLRYSVGGLLPLTYAEEAGLERAQRWEKEHRAP